MARSPKKVSGDETVHYVSARREREGRKKHGSVAIQPPLTPMIDIVFQLLLFFLLACQFRTAEGQIPANLPKVSGQKVTIKALDPIRIKLSAAGPKRMGVTIGIKGTNLTFASGNELYGYLKKIKDRYGDKEGKRPVYILPLGDVHWGHVVNAFNQGIRAKYKNVGFAPSEQ